MPEVTAEAPGRINLIGEHTDYQEGFVLPCAIPLRTRSTVRSRDDRRVTARSAELGGVIDYELGAEQRGRGWGDYIQGVTHVLETSGLTLRGFDLHVQSSVPSGSGLSSSAALEVSLLRALRTLFNLPVDDVEIARFGQRAEVEFVGARVGIMDQMASSLGKKTHALFLDTRTLAYEEIPLPRELGLAVVDSGVKHQHAGGEYLQRREEAERAAKLLSVSFLRDVPVSAVNRLSTLPRTEAKRARHIITENARVLRASDALRGADLDEFGRLLVESHESMRDDYEVSIPEVDLIVDLALKEPRVFGARLTGGGFGGCVVIAAEAAAARPIAHDVSRAYRERTGLPGEIRLPV